MSVNNTLGAGFIGDVLASVLFGISCSQAYYYYLNYPKDRTFHKIAVAILMILDAVHLAITTHGMYYYLITTYGQVSSSHDIIWSFKLQMAFNVAIVVTVQSLYALRVWKLGGHFSGVWPIVVILFVLGGLVTGTILVVKAYKIQIWTDMDDMRWSIYSTFSLSTGIDIALASAMCFYLNKARTPFSSTNGRITLVMHYVLISGVLTSACSLTVLITYSAMPTNLIFLGVSFLLTKLYVNSYLAMLNSRTRIRSASNSSSGPRGAGSMMNLRNLKAQVGPHNTTASPEERQIDSGYAFASKVDYVSGQESRTGSEVDPVERIFVHKTEERVYDGSGVV